MEVFSCPEEGGERLTVQIRSSGAHVCMASRRGPTPPSPSRPSALLSHNRETTGCGTRAPGFLGGKLASPLLIRAIVHD
jgi:hypothetical protein